MSTELQYGSRQRGNQRHYWHKFA